MPTYDYYPFRKGMTRTYASKTSQDVHILKIVTVAVTEDRGTQYARMRKTIEAPGKPPKVVEYDVYKDAMGVTERGEKTLPPAIKVGAAWQIFPRTYKLTSKTEKVKVPGGEFHKCVKIEYLLSGGEDGYGELYYAPNVGLIRRYVEETDDKFVIELTDFSFGL